MDRMEPSRNPQVADVVCERIERLIVDGVLKTGQLLPSERRLTEKLGVSRTALREGLKLLRARGIIKTEQGKGFATEATRRALSYAFRILNLHKVYLVVDTANEGAAHIYRKVGFVDEGVLREEYFSAGHYRDATRMAIFQRDFLSES